LNETAVAAFPSRDCYPTGSASIQETLHATGYTLFAAITDDTAVGGADALTRCVGH
jgi:hypothetical protein